MGEEEKYKLPSMDEAPWLLGTNENENGELEKQTFFAINNDSSYDKEIVELSGKSIVASVMGWLILRDRVNSRMYSVWNPVTGKTIALPELLDLPEETKPETCIFTSPPFEDGIDAAAECVLLLFCKGVVFLCRPTRDGCKWVKQCLEHDGESVRIVKAAVVNGDIYAYADLFNDNDEDDDHGSFHTVFARLTVSDGGDGSDGSMSSVIFEKLGVDWPVSKIVYKMIHRVISYLVEVSGVLYAVSIIPRQLDLENLDGYDILKAFVWTLDLLKMEWNQVESLGGDRALLLGHNCCTWCWADPSRDRIEGNCIYRVNIGSDTIHQYRLHYTSYSFVSSHTNFQNSSDGPSWFIPHNRTGLTSFEKTIVEKIQNTHAEELEVVEIAIPSLLLELPSGVMASIADRLHWFDSMNLRATCKKMRNDIPKPRFKANSSYPLFMFLKNTEGKCELWDPCYENSGSITKKLPFSPSIVSTIEFCKGEWLLLRSHEGSYLQYINLFTGESGEYPTESLAPGLSNFVFSTSPISPDCLTVGVSGMAYVDISLLRAGNVEWQTYQLDMQGGIDFQSNYNSSPKYHDGAFYFLDENGKLAVLKMLDNGFSWQVYKGPLEEDSKGLCECYIAELGGQLIYVYIQDLGSKVELYTFDVSEELWIELKSLGDYTLFVSSASSFSVPANDMSMKNRIYLPKRIGNEMVFYSLDTGKYHTSNSKESYENFHGMISQSFSCWV
ncbi:uncharacterized protein LOC141646707 [Silene latifolia]|uniref:uncharacterized protein LOC141646707 n=1 Tax=Silene latifolia TaxID=37657 RepID=UPI003D782E55